MKKKKRANIKQKSVGRRRQSCHQDAATQPQNGHTEQLLSAYIAGRLWNRSGWHMKQAWLLGNREQYELSCAAFDALLLKARECVPTSKRERLHASLKVHLENWEQGFLSVARLTELEHARHRLEQQYGLADDFEVARQECFEDSLTGTRAMLHILKTEIHDHLSEQQRKGFELGVLLDQGIRPGDVHRHMFATPKQIHQVASGSPFSTAGRPQPVEPCWANRRVRAGETPLERIWIRELRQRWTELELGAKWASPFSQSATVPSRAGRTALVRCFDRAIRESLISVQLTRGLASRFIIEHRKSAITMDAVVYQVKPDAPGFFEAVLKAQCNLISTREIVQAYPSLQGARLDRVRKDLPAPLRDLIESFRGKGYRLKREALT